MWCVVTMCDVATRCEVMGCLFGGEMMYRDDENDLNTLL